jgi:glutathione S-transferase
MRAFGHGVHDDIDSGAAIAIARAAEPEPSSGLAADFHGIALGDRVVVSATDTGVDPIHGELYAVAANRVSIARTDPRAGRVVVHVPLLGFELRRAQS